MLVSPIVGLRRGGVVGLEVGPQTARRLSNLCQTPPKLFTVDFSISREVYFSAWSKWDASEILGSVKVHMETSHSRSSC